MRNLNIVRWLSLVAGILLIIGGILFISNPLSSTLSLVQVISSILVAVGIIRVIRYFTDRVYATGTLLVGGILDIILGLMMMFNLTTSAIAFSVVISFWVLMNGILQIVIAIDLKKIGLSNWWVDLISGILGVILGIMLIGDFGLSTFYITIMTASYLIMFGIAFIATFIGLTKFRKENRY